MQFGACLILSNANDYFKIKWANFKILCFNSQNKQTRPSSTVRSWSQDHFPRFIFEPKVPFNFGGPVTVVGWTPRFELIHTAFFIIHYLLNCYAKNMETTYVKRPRRANQQPPKEVHSPQLRLPLRCVCPCYGLMTQLFVTSWSFKSQCVLASHLIIGSLNPNFGSLLQIRPGHPAAAFPWRFWRNSMASSSPIQPQGCPIHEGPPELSWLTCVGYIGLW